MNYYQCYRCVYSCKMVVHLLDEKDARVYILYKRKLALHSASHMPYAQPDYYRENFV